MIKPLILNTLTASAFFSLILTTSSAMANTAPNDADSQASTPTLRPTTDTLLKPTVEDWGWTDEKREEVQEQIKEWAYKMDDWFGEPDPKKPATASLRVVLDTRWADDPKTGTDVTIEPRIRGRLKLPVLEKRLSLIIGDGDLDEDTFLKQSTTTLNSQAANDPDRLLNKKRAREDNASIALRWSRFGKRLGIDTDIDLGIRSIDDLYLKVSLDKNWYDSKNLTISNDNFYRYGLDSEHYVSGGLNIKYGARAERFIHNRSTIRYRHQDEDEYTDWSNDLRQVHYLGNEKQLAYGVSSSGDFEGDKATLNSYGPAISYRQPVWRKWLYLQTELNYYNDKAEDKNHYPAALLRMEALF